MSGLANPRKNFRFLLELDGLNSFLVQEVQAPTVETSVIMHGAPGNIPDAKTPGKPKVSELVLKKLCPANLADTWAWDWYGAAIAGVRKDFIKTGFLKHLGPDGMITVQNFFLGDCWVSKIEPGNLMSYGDGENFIETVTLQCQFYFPKESPAIQQLFAGSAARAGGAAFLAGFQG